MAPVPEKPNRWIWYAARTGRCVPLDPAAYPTTIFQGEPTPLPAWVCRSPNGGLHIDHRRGRIDIDIAQTPVSGIEINWTCDYGVRVLSRAWLAEIEEILDESAVFIGDVRRKGRRMENWATLHQAGAPRLLGSEGWADSCPICGHPTGVLQGRRFFADPSIRGRPLIVNGQGVFVREDLALGRNLRRPAGSFKPTVVRFLADSPALKPRPAWLTPLGSPPPSAEVRQAPQPHWRSVISALWKASGRRGR
jgi:hypothetical protein